MDLAKDRIHGVFTELAASSPRFVRLTGASALEMSMQKDIYRLKSRSFRVVGRRPAQLRAFFLDMRAYTWDWQCLTPFQVAAWVRGRVLDGAACAGVVARGTLILVERATDVCLLSDHPLVQGQLALASAPSGLQEPALQAREITIDIMIALENFAATAPTQQLRCYAGFFILLGCSSLRAADAIRTRSLRLAEHSISGVSRMKGKHRWTRWFTDRFGFSGVEWSARWVNELSLADLPGPDFVLRAANGAMDQWLDRPAEYDDVRRALHLTLVLACSLSAAEAVLYNPHGFRHLLVSVGQQLRAFGVVSESDLERLGHWSKGSVMPIRYDAAAGVSELRARAALLNVVRNGWRPAKDGELPSAVSVSPAPVPDWCRVSSSDDRRATASVLTPPVPDRVVGFPAAILDCSSGLSSSTGVPDPGGSAASSSSVPDRLVGPCASVPDRKRKVAAVPSRTRFGFGEPNPSHTMWVANKTTKRVHTRGSNSSSTTCLAWACGPLAQPSVNTLTEEIPATWRKCRICFR